VERDDWFKGKFRNEKKVPGREKKSYNKKRSIKGVWGPLKSEPGRGQSGGAGP